MSFRPEKWFWSTPTLARVYEYARNVKKQLERSESSILHVRYTEARSHGHPRHHSLRKC